MSSAVLDGPVSGPRDLLPKDSLEYARRTIGYLRSVWIKTEGATRELEQVVEEAKSARVWERWPAEQPYGSWEEMLRSEIGASDAEVGVEIERRRLVGHGGDRRSTEFQVDNIKSNQTTEGGTKASYLLARLERDDETDLLLAIERGELSVRQAAIRAGYIKPKVSVDPTPDGLARWVRRHFTPEQIDALIEALEGEA